MLELWRKEQARLCGNRTDAFRVGLDVNAEASVRQSALMKELCDEGADSDLKRKLRKEGNNTLIHFSDNMLRS